MIQARIPFGYIGETRLRIDFYRRLALAETPAQLRAIEAELRDRFGKFGDEVRALLLVTEIRLRAEQKRRADRRNRGQPPQMPAELRDSTTATLCWEKGFPA